MLSQKRTAALPSRRRAEKRPQPSRPDSGAERDDQRSHVYGPVPSRRFGFSLGVDILPFKTCSLNCIYCQLGRTPRQTVRRASYYREKDILAQVRQALASRQPIDYVTFSGSGEPTLNSLIGGLIRRIKKMTSIPVAVLTNSTLLTRRSVRQALLEADVVAPSLDAAKAADFRRVNRPPGSLHIGDIISGLEVFRRQFKGQIWLEVMLVKGINDSDRSISALKKAIARIRPDRVHLNTVVRPPAETGVRPLSPAELDHIRRTLGGNAEVIAGSGKRAPHGKDRDIRSAILAMARRRPVTLTDMTSALGENVSRILFHLERLERQGKVCRLKHGRSVFFRSSDAAAG